MLMRSGDCEVLYSAAPLPLLGRPHALAAAVPGVAEVTPAAAAARRRQRLCTLRAQRRREFAERATRSIASEGGRWGVHVWLEDDVGHCITRPPPAADASGTLPTEPPPPGREPSLQRLRGATLNTLLWSLIGDGVATPSTAADSGAVAGEEASGRDRWSPDSAVAHVCFSACARFCPAAERGLLDKLLQLYQPPTAEELEALAERSSRSRPESEPRATDADGSSALQGGGVGSDALPSLVLSGDVPPPTGAERLQRLRRRDVTLVRVRVAALLCHWSEHYWGSVPRAARAGLVARAWAVTAAAESGLSGVHGEAGGKKTGHAATGGEVDVLLERQHAVAMRRALASCAAALSRPAPPPAAVREGARHNALARGGWLGADAEAGGSGAGAGAGGRQAGPPPSVFGVSHAQRGSVTAGGVTAAVAATLPIPRLPCGSSLLSPSLCVWRIDVVELARQWALADHELFCAIPRAEFVVGLGAGEKRDGRAAEAPHARAATARFNAASAWATASVLAPAAPKDRTVIFTRLCELMVALHRLHDFFGAMAIFSALESTDVRRLARTVALLPPAATAALADARTFFKLPAYLPYRAALAEACDASRRAASSEHGDGHGLEHEGHVLLRDHSVGDGGGGGGTGDSANAAGADADVEAAKQEWGTGFVPHLAVHAADLLKIDEGNDDALPAAEAGLLQHLTDEVRAREGGAVLNVEKWAMLVAAVDLLQAAQRSSYTLLPVRGVRVAIDRELSRHTYVGAAAAQRARDDMHALSAVREPAERALLASAPGGAGAGTEQKAQPTAAKSESKEAGKAEKQPKSEAKREAAIPGRVQAPAPALAPAPAPAPPRWRRAERVAFRQRAGKPKPKPPPG
eukprot:g778.t1